MKLAHASLMIALWFASGCGDIQSIETLPETDADASELGSVAVVLPHAGDVLRGKVVVDGSASRSDRVARFQFLADGAGIGDAVLTGYGWILEWDSRTVLDGAHTISARVTYRSGRVAIAPGVDVVVSNQVVVADAGKPPPPVDAGVPSAGNIVISVALSMNKTSAVVGDTLRGTVTFTNTGGTSVPFQRMLIAGRAPGSVNVDLSPEPAAGSLAPGQSITVNASRVIASGAVLGTWGFYATWQDTTGAWTWGPTVNVNVSQSAPPPPPVDAGTPVVDAGTPAKDAGTPVVDAGTPSGDPKPVGVAGTWSLVFRDEFNGTALDTRVWDPHWFNEGGSMNNVGTYAANVSVKDGNLVLIRAGATSGSLVNTESNNGFAVQVGMYTEARIYFSGDGTNIYNWAAWWISSNPWPNGGEHDIAEVLGGKLTVNYHSPSGSHNQGAPAGYWGNAYHVYGIHRKASSADVYWDGKLVKSYPTDDNGTGEYLIFNVGSGSPSMYGTASEMRIDYVRVWK